MRKPSGSGVDKAPYLDISSSGQVAAMDLQPSISANTGLIIQLIVNHVRHFVTLKMSFSVINLNATSHPCNSREGGDSLGLVTPTSNHGCLLVGGEFSLGCNRINSVWCCRSRSLCG